ncbi:MAG: hypothetical protein C6W56_10305 [Caldibacillus debilis]|nr:MAG: hypothetical protein C6W56_10305 [Caldibacillus debilis]
MRPAGTRKRASIQTGGFSEKRPGKNHHECRQPPFCDRYSYGQGRRVCQGQGRNFDVRRIRDPAGGPYTGAVRKGEGRVRPGVLRHGKGSAPVKERKRGSKK